MTSPGTGVRGSDLRRTSPAWSLGAAGLFLGSAGLQLLASLQRWGPLSEARIPGAISIEDHRFDYTFPADPWEAIGSAAQLFGAGSLLLALGVLAVARAARSGALDRLIAAAVAGSFTIVGLHALLSAALGAPSPAQYPPLQLLLASVQIVGLLVLASRWAGTSAAISAAVGLLIGSTLVGYLVASFVVAPAIAGYQSHDTTPWTETIVAATTAAAGFAMLAAAAFPGRRRSAGTAAVGAAG